MLTLFTKYFEEKKAGRIQKQSHSICTRRNVEKIKGVEFNQLKV